MRWAIAAFIFRRRPAPFDAVVPANIKHAFEGVRVARLPHSWLYHGPRLALQPVLVWWALFASGVISWPFKSWPFKPKSPPSPQSSAASAQDAAGEQL